MIKMKIIITGDSQGFEHEELEKIYKEISKNMTVDININEIKYKGIVSQLQVEYKDRKYIITKLRAETL